MTPRETHNKTLRGLRRRKEFNEKKRIHRIHPFSSTSRFLKPSLFTLGHDSINESIL